MNELAKATQSVLDWAEGRTDTLIIVTADHETGGLTVTGSPGGTPTYTWGTVNHTMTPVPVYATGPNADLVNGARSITRTSRASCLDGRPRAADGDGNVPPGRGRVRGRERTRTSARTTSRSHDGAATKLVVDA